jgi:hypothetical protein
MSAEELAEKMHSAAVFGTGSVASLPPYAVAFLALYEQCGKRPCRCENTGGQKWIQCNACKAMAKAEPLLKS